MEKGTRANTHSIPLKAITMASNKEIVQQINEAFNNSDLQTFLDHCADDVQWTIVGKDTMHGKDAISAFMGKMDPAYAMEIGVDTIIAEGNSVACNGTMQMKHEGGTPYRGAYSDVYLFKEGRVATLHSYVVDLKGDAVTN